MNNRIHTSGIVAKAFPEISLRDSPSYYSQIGDAAHALAYGWLYWPNLVELHGAVFLGLYGNDEAEILKRLTKPSPASAGRAGMSWTSAVDSFNLFEILYLFQQELTPVSATSDVLMELGAFLAEAWHARLLVAYPDRVFAVQLLEVDEHMVSRIEVSQVSPVLAEPDGWDPVRRVIVR